MYKNFHIFSLSELCGFKPTKSAKKFDEEIIVIKEKDLRPFLEHISKDFNVTVTEHTNEIYKGSTRLATIVNNKDDDHNLFTEGTL